MASLYNLVHIILIQLHLVSKLPFSVMILLLVPLGLPLIPLILIIMLIYGVIILLHCTLLLIVMIVMAVSRRLFIVYPRINGIHHIPSTLMSQFSYCLVMWPLVIVFCLRKVLGVEVLLNTSESLKGGRLHTVLHLLLRLRHRFTAVTIMCSIIGITRKWIKWWGLSVGSYFCSIFVSTSLCTMSTLAFLGSSFRIRFWLSIFQGRRTWWRDWDLLVWIIGILSEDWLNNLRVVKIRRWGWSGGNSTWPISSKLSELRRKIWSYWTFLNTQRNKNWS